MSDISTDAMMREAAMMDASDNHVWARKVRRLCIERDNLKAQIAALPPAPDAVGAVVEAAEAWEDARNALSAFEAENPGDSTKRWARLLSSTEAAEETFWTALAAIRGGAK
jgi:hypothetical protein